MLMIVDDAALMPKVLISGVNVPTGLTYIVPVKMPANSCTKLLLHHVPSSVLSLWLGHLPQQKPVEPSLSVHPPSSPLDDLLSHSLTFSLRLIPLTMHVPKTDLIFIHGATPNPPSCTLHHHTPALPPFQIQAMYPVPVQVHHLTSPLLHLEPHPHPSSIPPHHVLPCWNLEACVAGVCTNPEHFGGIKP